MKNLKNSLLLFALCLFTMNLSAQDWKSDKNKDPVSKETRSVGSFDVISVASGIDLYIRQGNKQDVTVKASDKIKNKLMTEVENGTLKIYMKKGSYRNVRMDVYVTIDELTALHASGGSDVYCKSTFASDQFEIHASGGSDIEMSIEVGKLECHLSGGSDLEIEGTAEELHIHASGSSDFEGYGLETKHCVVQASGSSDSSIHVTESLEVNASGSSDVDYKGNPSETKIKSTGGSDVHSH